jgi:hypothetical protein
MSTPRVIAVDWSGARMGAARKIWLAEVADGALRRLESGRGREALTRLLIDEAERDPDLVVGLDFAFSFPLWHLQERGLDAVQALWELSAPSRAAGLFIRRGGLHAARVRLAQDLIPVRGGGAGQAPEPRVGRRSR